MRDSEGASYVKESMPFIERHDAPYDISNFALTNGQSNSGFDFTFVDCPSPDRVFVQRWPRNQQGTTGTVANGEIVDFEMVAPSAKYHASSLEPGYIYSIYAFWGPYYGEYSFLVSTQESDRAYWRLEVNSEPEEGNSPEGVSFEGTVFHYGGQDYDISTRIESVNSILSVVPVGKKFVIECHIGPKNGAYCIFDTENKSFDEDIIGNNLVWHSDDITTSVYSFWSEVHTYDGSIIKTYDVAEDSFIRNLAFSDDYTKLAVTIAHDDSTDETDTITLLKSYGNSERLSIGTPEYVYATYYSGPDIHDWELSQDEINDWVVWLNNLTISPINLEESKTLIDYMYYNSNNPQYSFDVRVADRLECIAYYGCGLEHTYLRMDNTWYCVDNPTEPFNKLF